MNKNFSISFMTVLMLLITPLSLPACHWLEKWNNAMEAKTSVAAETGRSTHKALTDRLKDSDISRGAMVEFGSGSVIQNKTLNDNEE